MQRNSESAVKQNKPELWEAYFPRAGRADHKYSRGHAVISGGTAAHSGAALLASEAALRAGAGLVSLVVPAECLSLYAAAARKAVIKRVDEELPALLEDARSQAWLLGPGLGVSQETREKVKLVLLHQKPVVLDADALSSFAEVPEQLFAMLRPDCMLTPHEGEFVRIFPDIAGNKTERAEAAARRAGVVVVLKGADTVIAHPEEGVIVNSVDAPQLATAGSGDVLAGICTGLMAQRMPAFMAAAAAVWLHAVAAQNLGQGMIADDLLTELRQVIHPYKKTPAT